MRFFMGFLLIIVESSAIESETIRKADARIIVGYDPLHIIEELTVMRCGDMGFSFSGKVF